MLKAPPPVTFLIFPSSSLSPPPVFFDDSFINDNGWGLVSDGCQTVEVTNANPSTGSAALHLRWDADQYPELDLVEPPALSMLRAADELKPDVIHVSTPGPVGCAGVLAARLHDVPLVGVYHTDFPSYVDNLLEDRALTVAAEKFGT